jgi:predicted CopG family antitoxin
MNTKTKEITEEQAEQIIEWEAQSLSDAIGNCIELNQEFLERYCSKELAEALKEIPEKDREFHLQSHIGEWRELNYFDSGLDINLQVGEIEWQEEDGSLHYVPCLGIAFKVDIESLKEDWKEWNRDD